MTRYAVYFAPRPGSLLDQFGRHWVGRDAWTDIPVDQPSVDGIDLAAATAFPRRYGFHATLKAPFSLAATVDEAGLLAALTEFGTARAPVEAPPLRLATLGDFLALVPSSPCPQLDAFAADCVRRFEPYRAPLSQADRQRRLKSPLTTRQRTHLETWGYPYVFEEFTFHMTLSGPLAREQRDVLEIELRTRLIDIAAAPFVLDCVVLSKQPDEHAPFRIVASQVLRGG